MRLARSHFLVSVLAFLCAFALTIGSAFAAGTITYARKDIQESVGAVAPDDDHRLRRQTGHRARPHALHLRPHRHPRDFLDDAHGDKPQKRKIPLVGQTPMQESVDVDFSDSRGKLFDRTRFDFNITRSHNFVAGDYSVTVHRADGATIGTTQTLVLLGDNPVIDRRTISFVGAKKDKPAAAAGADAGAGESKTASAATGDQAAAPPATRPPPPRPRLPPKTPPIPPLPKKYPPPRTAADAEW